MGLKGLILDRHFGRYLDHSIEVVEDGVAKRVRLLLDGREVASESCVLPQEIALSGTLEGKPVAAKVTVRFLRGSLVSVDVDGAPVALTRDG